MGMTSGIMTITTIFTIIIAVMIMLEAEVFEKNLDDGFILSKLI